MSSKRTHIPCIQKLVAWDSLMKHVVVKGHSVIICFSLRNLSPLNLSWTKCMFDWAISSLVFTLYLLWGLLWWNLLVFELFIGRIKIHLRHPNKGSVQLQSQGFKQDSLYIKVYLHVFCVLLMVTPKSQFCRPNRVTMNVKGFVCSTVRDDAFTWSLNWVTSPHDYEINTIWPELRIKWSEYTATNNHNILLRRKRRSSPNPWQRFVQLFRSSPELRQ